MKREFKINGALVRKLRLASPRRITQVELGKIIGVSGPQVSKIELQHRTGNIDIAAKIAQYFHTSVDELLMTDDERWIPADKIPPLAATNGPSRKTCSQLILPEGNVTVEFPDELSVRSYERLQSWLELVIRMARPKNL